MTKKNGISDYSKLPNWRTLEWHTDVCDCVTWRQCCTISEPGAWDQPAEEWLRFLHRCSPIQKRCCFRVAHGNGRWRSASADCRELPHVSGEFVDVGHIAHSVSHLSSHITVFYIYKCSIANWSLQKVSATWHGLFVLSIMWHLHWMCDTQCRLFATGVLHQWSVCTTGAASMVCLYQGCCINGLFVPWVLHQWSVCTKGAASMVCLYHGCCINGLFVPRVLHQWSVCTKGAASMVCLHQGCCINGLFVPRVLHQWSVCTTGAASMVCLYHGCCINGLFVPRVLHQWSVCS